MTHDVKAYQDIKRAIAMRQTISRGDDNVCMAGSQGTGNCLFRDIEATEAPGRKSFPQLAKHASGATAHIQEIERAAVIQELTKEADDFVVERAIPPQG